MANVQISAVDVEAIWYADSKAWADKTSRATGADVAAIIATAKQVENVHQDTWQIEESEASQDKYKNQLTGNVYRMGAKEMGEVTVSFTIGRYDYATKADLLGGTVTYDGIGTSLWPNKSTSPTAYYRTKEAAIAAGVDMSSISAPSNVTSAVFCNDEKTDLVFYTSSGAGHTKSVTPDATKGNAVGWERARGIVELKKILIARTEDKQYVIFPQANFNTREANTDKAIGLAVSATAMEPDNINLSAEYWYDESEVK